MDFLKLAAERYSVRKFAGRQVEPDALEKILQAGHLAPTAKNLQPQKIFVLQSSEALEKIKNCTACHFNAPTVLLICHDTEVEWERPFDGKRSGDIDASIVTTHMMLEAAALGLGTTWVMWFDADKVIEEFQLPANIVPTALLPLGYPADDAVPAARHTQFRDAKELVSYL